MSIMELSHRSKAYDEVHNEAIARLKRLFSIPENYEVLFLQGGASLQFSMIPNELFKPWAKSRLCHDGSMGRKSI